MLRILKDLERYTLCATDGDVGRVDDFLLDDQRWAVRYLVVDTAGFLDGPRVLISPISFGEVEWSSHRFHVTLTRQKVRNSPDIDLDKSVSRQHERQYLGYYDYPYYWGYAAVWGMGGYPGLLATRPWMNPPAEVRDEVPGDAHLRSAREVRGYDIQGRDGGIGHVENFIVDDETWEIRYLVVDTSNWWFGKRVLIAPSWAREVSWEHRLVKLDMTRAAIKASPPWDAEAPVNREYEQRLYDYHGRPVYWSRGDRSATPVSKQQNV